MNEIVGFEIELNGQPLPQHYQVVSIEVSQVSRDNFLASFSIQWNIIPEFVAPDDIAVGDGLTISAGYDNSLALIFLGTVSQITLHGDAGQGFYFTVDGSSQKNTFTATTPATSPQLGVDIIDIEISKNATHNIGFITIPGTRDYWVGYPIIFPYIGAADITEVKHLIEDGVWHTTLFTGQNTGYHKSKIVLQTSGGNSIILDDTTNSITLNNAGNTSTIQLNPEGLQLKSDNNITANANGKTAISATDDLELKGNMIHIN